MTPVKEACGLRRLLQQLAAGERINDSDLEWPNIIEEVADVGRNSLRAGRLQLLQGPVHDLKAEAWPLSRDVPHWRSEARVARIDAVATYSPSMRAKGSTSLTSTLRRCAIPDMIDGLPPLPLSDTCLATRDELLSE